MAAGTWKAVCIAIALLGAGGGAPATARTDIPVRQTTMPDTTIRYSVPVTIGSGAPIEAELDTGSFGLRVLSAAVKPDDYEATGIRRTYAFDGGAKFEGFLARAHVAVGSARADAPLLMMVIDHVSCTEAKPDCPASRLTPEEYGIAGGGVANHGYKAILGVSLRRAASDESAPNPLTLLSGSWILSLPRPGSAEPGHLILDPDPGERSGFTLLQLRPEAELSDRLSGWADAALPGCLVDRDGGMLCGDTIIDSGASGVSIESRDVSEPAAYGPGKPVTFEIGGAHGPVSMPFITGRDTASRVMLRPVKGSGNARISIGSLPFFAFDVLYDVKSGTMGFRRREPETPP